MTNKHQIQKDFYTKMSGWKESLKVDSGTKQHIQEILKSNQASYEKIKNKSKKISIEELENSEYMEASIKIDEKIEQAKRKQAKALREAQYDMYR